MRGLAETARDRLRGARLLAGFVRGAPVHCIVQVSNRCNLTCGFCSFWERPARPEDEMTLEDVRTISDKLAEAGSMIVSIEGGEPLLRLDAVEIVRAFRRHHHPILFTNGWRVTPGLARELWSAGLDTIGVSIDYADAARHDAHRGRAGTFDAAWRAVDVLRDAAPLGGRQVCVMTVLVDDNADDLAPLIERSGRAGVGHQVTLVSTGGMGRKDSAQRPPAPGIGAHLLALKREHPHFVSFTGYLEGIDPYLRGRGRPTCHAGERFLNVDHLGDVSPCIEKLQRRAGNLLREPWDIVYGRLRAMTDLRTCGDCHTSCRGFVDEMSGAPKLRSYRELFTNFAKEA